MQTSIIPFYRREGWAGRRGQRLYNILLYTLAGGGGAVRSVGWGGRVKVVWTVERPLGMALGDGHETV